MDYKKVNAQRQKIFDELTKNDIELDVSLDRDFFQNMYELYKTYYFEDNVPYIEIITTSDMSVGGYFSNTNPLQIAINPMVAKQACMYAECFEYHPPHMRNAIWFSMSVMEHEIVHAICYSYFDRKERNNMGSWKHKLPPDKKGGHHKLFMSILFNVFYQSNYTCTHVPLETSINEMICFEYWKNKLQIGHRIQVKSSGLVGQVEKLHSSKFKLSLLEKPSDSQLNHGRSYWVRYGDVQHCWQKDGDSLGDALNNGPSAQYLKKKKKLVSRHISRNQYVLTTKLCFPLFHEVKNAYQNSPMTKMCADLYSQSSVKGSIVFFEVGTGKTLAALHTAVAYRTLIEKTTISESSKREKARVVCVTTTSNVESTWGVQQKLYSKYVKNLPSWKTFMDVFSFVDFNQKKPRQSVVNAIDDNTLLIIDEAHILRNTQSHRFLKEKCRLARYVLLLTATPIYNNMEDVLQLDRLCRERRPKIKDRSFILAKNNPRQVKSGFKKHLSDTLLYQATNMTDFAKDTHIDCEVELDIVNALIDLGRQKRNDIGTNLRLWIHWNYRQKPQFPICIPYNKDLIASIHQDQYTLLSQQVVGDFMNSFLQKTRQWNNTPAKICAIIARIRQDVDRRRVVIFSHFVSKGIEIFLKSVKTHKDMKISYLKSNLSTTERATMVKSFNQGEPKPTTFFKVLLLTPASIEGLSLKNVRSLHIIEPGWEPFEENQIIGRTIRKGSHSQLCDHEKQVNIYHWVSIIPKRKFTFESNWYCDVDFSLVKSTDEHCRDKLKIKRQELSPVLDAIKDVGTKNVLKFSQ